MLITFKHTVAVLAACAFAAPALTSPDQHTKVRVAVTPQQSSISAPHGGFVAIFK